MNFLTWVAQTAGVPSALLFTITRGLGTPIVIDNLTNRGYYWKNNVGVTPLGGVWDWTALYLAVDDTATSTTPAATPLSFTPKASALYEVEALLLLEAETATIGPKVGISWPTGLLSGGATIRIPTADGTEVLLNLTAGVDDEAIAPDFPAASTPYLARLSAFFSTGPTPSGNFAVTLAKEV